MARITSCVIGLILVMACGQDESTSPTLNRDPDLTGRYQSGLNIVITDSVNWGGGYGVLLNVDCPSEWILSQTKPREYAVTIHVVTEACDLPDSVTAAMRIGFRRLSKEAQLVLAAASVLGDHNSEATLGSACGLDPAMTAQALDELEWQRWLETDVRGYAFVARLAGQVIARDMVTPGQRRRFQAHAGSGLTLS